MAKQIENRVVEMEFKNKDFEKAISVTMESLDELNKKLDELNKINMSGFEQMTQKMNDTNFDKLSNSIDYIKSRFSLIGIAAQELKGKIVDSMFEAAQAVGNVFGSIEDTIKEKGKSRATNLAQAKFQLKGLGIAWNQVSDSIDEAVNDTRFGLDEAAMAASQLAASGVQLGEDMTHALLGISGVAAMTNSEYSDMAHIFTTVAGTGKLYTQQLNMIASRGLNATAAIAHYMGITEAEVREIISNKDTFIDFATFAEAMFSEYGAQAKKGNDLFSGAFANAKAALGRIGEKFYTPFYEYARQTLVAVKPVINDFNAALTPFFTALDKAMANTKDIAVNILSEIHKTFTGDENGDDYSIDLFGKTINAKDDFEAIVSWAETLIKGLGETLNGSNGVMSLAGEALANIFYNLYEVIVNLGHGIHDVFGDPSMSSVVYYLSVFRDWTENARLTDEQLESIKRTVRGITSALDILLKTGLAIYKVFVRPILESLGIVGDTVFDITGDIGDLLYILDQDYDPFVPMFNTLQRFKQDISPVTDAIKFLIDSIKNGFSDLTGITTFEELITKIEEILSNWHVTDIIGGVFYGVGYAINFAANTFETFKEAVAADDTFKTFIDNITAQSKVLSWLRDTFEKIKTTIKDLIAGKITLVQALGLDKLSEKFEKLNPIIEKFKEHYKSIFEVSKGSEHTQGLPFISEFGEKLKTAIKELKWEDIFGLIGAGFYAYWIRKKEQIAESIAGSVKVFSDAFKSLTEGINLSLIKMTKETKAEQVLKIAASVALLAGSVYLLARVEPQKIWIAVGAIAALAAVMVGFVAILDRLTKSTKFLYRESQTISDPGGSKTTKTKGGKKNPITTVVEKLAASFTETQETIEEKISSFAELPMLLLSFAASIGIIALALGYLTAAYDANPEAFKGAAKTLAVIFVALAAVAAGMMVLSNRSFAVNPVTVAALAKMFLAMAFALDLITFPIIALTALLALTKNNEVGAAVALAMGILLSLAVIAGLFSVFVNACTVGPMLAGAGAMMMMAAAVGMMVFPIAAFAAIAAMNPEALVGAIATVSALLFEMTAFVVIFGVLGALLPASLGGMLAGAGAMIMMAVAINMLMMPIAAITALAAVNPEALIGAIAVLSWLMVIMTMIAAVFAIITTATSGIGAAGMLAGALSMILMAKALQALIIPLAAFAAMDANGSFENAIKNVAQALATLAIASMVVMLIAPGLAIMISLLIGLASAILIFAESLYLVGKGALDFVMALALLQAISLDGLSEKIAEAGKAMIDGFRSALTAGQADIQEGFVALIAAGLGALTGSLGMITEAIILLLYDIIQAIDNHAQPLGYALGHAISDILWYAASGAIASTGDFFGKILGLENGNGISDWLKDRLMNEKSEKKGILQMLSDKWFGNKNDVKKEIAEPVGTEVADEVYVASAEGMADEGNKQKLTKATEENVGGALNDAGPGILSNSNLPDILKQYVGDGVDGYEGALDVQNGKSLLYEGSTEYITAGAVSGIEKGTPDYENAIAKMAKSGNNRFLKENNMASPSKLYAQYGEYIDQGLAMGIDKSDASEESIANRSTALASVFSNIGETAKNSIGGSLLSPLSAAMSSLTSDISEYEDYQPTITPVFDMSNVANGFNTLNSMFSNQRSIALASDVSTLDTANRMLNVQIQNDNRNRTNDSIGLLGSKLDTLGEAIMNRQIVLDSGELVGGLVNPMDRSLGIRAIKAQRSGA